MCQKSEHDTPKYGVLAIEKKPQKQEAHFLPTFSPEAWS